MNLEELVRRVVGALEAANIPYVLVGSLSSNFYGVSRGTQDADIVVSCPGARISELMRALGSEFERNPQLAFETVTATTKTLLRVKQTGFQIEIFFLSSDEHDQERFSRRKKVAMFGREAYVLSLEDVLITKLRWLHLAGRRKDEDDLRAVLRLQHHRVDWPYVESWCDRHGTQELLERLRKECVPDS
jgi:hypothetical protein